MITSKICGSSWKRWDMPLQFIYEG